jgi:hypothetical protein
MIGQFQNQSHDTVLTRYKKGVFRDGVFYSEVDFRRRIVASIQPMNAKELETTPDNLVRVSEFVKIYTDIPLIPSDPDNGQKGDEITTGKSRYIVQSVADYNFPTYTSHYKSIASKAVK